MRVAVHRIVADFGAEDGVRSEERECSILVGQHSIVRWMHRTALMRGSMLFGWFQGFAMHVRDFLRED